MHNIKSGVNYEIAFVWKKADGTADTGLSPTVTMYKLSNSSAVLSAQAMTEVALGIYKYDIATANLVSGETYAIQADGTASADDATLRYQYDFIAVDYASTKGIADNVTAILEDTGTTIPAIIGTPTDTDIATDIANVPGLTWDELITGSSHNTVTSAGRRLRDISTSVIREAIAQGGGDNYITLDASASSTNGAYDPAEIFISDGTGAGQSRLILEYNGTTKRAYVDRTWKVNPSSDSEYTIVCNPGRGSTNEGLLQAGGTTSVTLNTLATQTDDIYNGQVIQFVSGTGEDQAAQIIDYVGSTRVATLDRTLATAVDSTTCYVIMPFEIVTPSIIADAIWDENLTGHTGTDTAGGRLDAPVSTSSSGSGSIAHTLYFADSNNTPQAGLVVWLTTDSAGNNKFTSTNNRTNSGGRITFYIELNTTYYVWDANHSTSVSSFTRTSA